MTQNLRSLIYAFLLMLSASQLATAVPSNSTMHTFDRRGNGVGEIDDGTYSQMWNKRQPFGCGNNICFSPSCILSWRDTHGCQTPHEIGGICDDIWHIGNRIYKDVCGIAWANICNYTKDYIASFMWNGVYELTVTTTKRSRLSAGFNSDKGKSCKYGTLLSKNYRGDFSCQHLLDNYRTMIDRIPYDGC